MLLRDVLETISRSVRTTETGARSNIQDAENNEERRKDKLKDV
jgi:hypothetical protein